MTLKTLSEQEKEEIKEAIERWAKAARETAKRDPKFAETLRKTPFHGLMMRSGTSRKGKMDFLTGMILEKMGEGGPEIIAGMFAPSLCSDTFLLAWCALLTLMRSASDR